VWVARLVTQAAVDREIANVFANCDTLRPGVLSRGPGGIGGPIQDSLLVAPRMPRPSPCARLHPTPVPRLPAATVLAGCSTAEVTPSASVTTLMPDAERWFKLGWETAPGRDGSVRLRGYLVNTYGEPAGRCGCSRRRSTPTGTSSRSVSSGCISFCQPEILDTLVNYGGRLPCAGR